MLGQHVQGDVLCGGRLGLRLRLRGPLGGSDAHQYPLLNLEVTPAIGRPHRVMEVGGYLYVAIQPAGAPVALEIGRASCRERVYDLV